MRTKYVLWALTVLQRFLGRLSYYRAYVSPASSMFYCDANNSNLAAPAVVLPIGGLLSSTYPGLAQAGSPTTTPTAIPTVAANKQWTPAEQTFGGIKMVLVPPGCFMMGSTYEQVTAAMQAFDSVYGKGKAQRSWYENEQPPHQVCLTKGYWLDAYEVTNAAYQQFVDAGGYTTRDYWSDAGWSWKGSMTAPGDCGSRFNDPQQPRVCVTWYEAEAYAKWRGGRLPTEAEWEYAARGPDSLIYPWGNTWDGSKANTYENSGGKTKPVGSYENGKSWVGAYDLAGNVWEWVADWYTDTYDQQQVKNDPLGPTDGKYRGLRGGSLLDPLRFASAACRIGSLPLFPGLEYGFRLVVEVRPPSQ